MRIGDRQLGSNSSTCPRTHIATSGRMAGNSPVVRELKQATTTIPIVMAGAADPVGYGFVTNIARPEANVTGVAYWGSDMLPKRIELLSEVVPQLRRLAIIGGNRDATFIKIIDEGDK